MFGEAGTLSPGEIGTLIFEELRTPMSGGIGCSPRLAANLGVKTPFTPKFLNAKIP